MEETFTTLFSAGTILAQIFIIAIIILFLKNPKHKYLKFFGEHGILLAFTLSLFGMLASLYYSEVALLAPCDLCWYQRIFLYSAVFVLGTALFQRKPWAVIPYGIILSFAGSLISIYHIYVQFFVKTSVTCSLTSTVSCSERYVTNFGYITIPVMSLTSFLLVAIFLFLAKKYYESR